MDRVQQLLWQSIARCRKVIQTGFGADDKTGRHIQPDLCHHAKVGSFAAKQLFVFAIAFFKRKNLFFRFACVAHGIPPEMVCTLTILYLSWLRLAIKKHYSY